MSYRRKWQNHPLLRECVIPAIMLTLVGAYWWDAAGLSLFATAFPAALTGCLVLFLLLVGLDSVRAGATTETTDGSTLKPDQRPNIWLQTRRLAVVILPATLFFFLETLGGLVLLYLYLAALLLLLGERRGTMVVFLPAGLAFGGVALFKYVLYVRIPDGMFSLGFFN